MSILATHLILSKKVKGQRSRSLGHKVQKRISLKDDRVAGVSMHSIECQSSPVVKHLCYVLKYDAF